MDTPETVPNAIWVVKPRSNVIHVIAEMKFMPSLCGMVPPGKGKTAGKWSVLRADYVKNAVAKHGLSNRLFCQACLKQLTQK